MIGLERLLPGFGIFRFYRFTFLKTPMTCIGTRATPGKFNFWDLRNLRLHTLELLQCGPFGNMTAPTTAALDLIKLQISRLVG